MIQLVRDWLWCCTGIGQPPADLVCSQAKTGTAIFGIAWAAVTAAGIVSGCFALAPTAGRELANMRCSAVSGTIFCLLLAGLPLLGLPRIGLEVVKATGWGVPVARLCVVAASTAWWTLTALMGLFLFFPISR